MIRHTLLLLSCCNLAFAGTKNELSFKEDTKGKLFPADAEITEVLIDGAYKFTEGPAWTGEFFIFSDIPASKIYRWNSAGKATLFRENSHNTNGNIVDQSGNIYSCQHGKQQVVTWKLTDQFTDAKVLAGSFEKNPLNRPNDLAKKSDGSIWFTDPSYGYKEGENPPQGGSYVYRISPDATKITRVAEGFDKPNGITFSPDEKTLYVTDASAKLLYKYEVQGDKLGPRILIDDTFKQRGVDGICCDSSGHLFVTYSEGVRVYDSESNHIGDILTEEHPTNCTFGGPEGNILLITARKKVYAVKTSLKAPELAK